MLRTVWFLLPILDISTFAHANTEEDSARHLHPPNLTWADHWDYS